MISTISGTVKKRARVSPLEVWRRCTLRGLSRNAAVKDSASWTGFWRLWLTRMIGVLARTMVRRSRSVDLRRAWGMLVYCT